MPIPHPIPYQGSKRALAVRILSYLPPGERLIEPFAGSAAITLAAAARHLYARFLVADALGPLIEIWRLVLTNPQRLCDSYEQLWASQLPDARRFYDQVRDQFNSTHDPCALLYLLARCVKASVRFNADGEFNQSPDNRRLGMRPSVMRREVMGAHMLLSGRTELHAADFRDTLSRARPGDVVYLDPPYQGISEGRDRRYHQRVGMEELASELLKLNSRGIPFALSYDGSCGDRSYGRSLPEELDLARIRLHAGRSTQSTLSGRAEVTVESLYLSPVARSSLRAGRRATDGPQQLALQI